MLGLIDRTTGVQGVPGALRGGGAAAALVWLLSPSAVARPKPKDQQMRGDATHWRSKPEERSRRLTRTFCRAIPLGMPSVASKTFVQGFQDVLARGGKISKEDLAQLQTLRRAISHGTEAAAADGILSFLRHDLEFDRFEVAPARKALGVLLGVSTGRLPADLDKVLRNAVPVPNVTVQHYDLSFDLTAAGPAFPARAIITLDKPAGSKPIVLEAYEDRLNVERVLVDGSEVPFSMKDNRLHVNAPGAASIEVQYAVRPVDKDDANAYGLIRDKYTGRMWTLTWPYNTGALFPSNSHPADGATSKVTVRIPQGHEAVGPGNGATSFETNHEAPAYSVAFYTANRFAHGPGMCSCHGVTVTAAGKGNEVPKAIRESYTKAAADSLDFYSDWLGGYDYGTTLKLVEADGGLGGMEHTGAVAIMMGAAKDPEESRVVAAHETAHHWFGNNIRIKHWGDFWMSEGFTNYATYRFLRHADGEDRFRKLMSDARRSVTSSLKDNPHALSAPAHTDVNEIFDDVPYEMGPWILRMMEVKLGTGTFDGLLKAWFQDKRGSAVSTEDFIAFAKGHTGEDLSGFFAAWNSISAVPELKGKAKISGTDVKVSLEVLNALPKGTLIPLRLEGGGGASATVMVEPGKAQTFSAAFDVKRVRWDPDMTVLANVRSS